MNENNSAKQPPSHSHYNSYILSAFLVYPAPTKLYNTDFNSLFSHYQISNWSSTI